MRLKDVPRALAGISHRLREPPSIPPLEGVHLASLVRDEFSRDRRASARSEESSLFYPAAVRLGRRIRPRVFFYSFENHMWEKMLCAGTRHADPGIRLIGYAHSVVAPMYLFYTLAEVERMRVPLPDIICVNGPRARDVLRKNGFSGSRIEVTGAFRYPDVHTRPRRTAHGSRPFRILVTPTAGVHETLELARKAAEAFPDPGDFRVTLKLHPTLPLRKISPHLKPYCPPVTLSEIPVSRLLETTDLLLVMESASAVEALAAGIPVIHVRSDFRLDMNLFEGLDWVPSLSRSDEIRSMAQSILEEGFTPAGLPADPAGEFFAPVSEESLDRLLQEEGSTRMDR
jgi:surface carbohydrate biosynthesis protein (TIGR04326 family)